MTGEPHNQPPGRASAAIDRRHAVGWLTVALAGLGAGKALAQGGPPPLGPIPPEAVTFLDAATLRRTIRAAPEENPGQPGLYSLSLSGGAGYPIIGIRRTIVTRSEVHASFTDVWYVLEGTATIVTGGAIVGGVETGPGEVRGRSIAGGEARRIGAGDFAVVPAGVPHWVSRVGPGELLYFVVKVPTPK